MTGSASWPTGRSSDPANGPQGGRDGDWLAPLLPGGEPVESLLRRAQFFVPGTPSGDYRELHRAGPASKQVIGGHLAGVIASLR
ncbi:MAG: hypothetical protein ACR2MP_31625 [Streptosporangiaceae bacterium]